MMEDKNNKKINKDNKNKRIKIIVILLILILGSIITINHITRNNVYVYYRTYTKENGWSKWVKNGETSGNKKDDILNIQIKLKNDTSVIYNLYTDDWNDSFYNNDSKIDNKKIKGIEISLMDKYYKKYDIYYRTYNSKNKWLEWTSNKQISGNKDKTIKGIEIDIIKKYTVPNEILKDYNKSDYDSNVNF